MLRVTREKLQVDRLASAWLIRRFVDPEVVFGFVPRGNTAADDPDAIARASAILDALYAALRWRRARAGNARPTES